MRRRHPSRRMGGAPFVRLEHPMIDSMAFNDLNFSSVMVLISILRRYNGFNGTRPDPIVCPYSAMQGGLSTATIAKGIRDLEVHGFIERIQRGGLMKQPNTYALLIDWRNWRAGEKQNATS